jgi:hypothetical protein
METLELEFSSKAGCTWDLGGYRDSYELEDGRRLFVSIDHDECDCDPREWDNVGIMACWHRNYNLGDEQPKSRPEEWMRDLACALDDTLEDRIWYWESGNGWTYLAANYEDPVAVCDAKISNLVDGALDKHVPVMLPLYLYDHSGITMNTSGFSCPWDSGQVGWIYATREKILEEQSAKRLTKRMVEWARRLLIAEVEEYDHYLTGNVWGYSIKVVRYDKCESCDCVSEVEEFEESCWGYLGDPEDYLLDEVNRILEKYGVGVSL